MGKKPHAHIGKDLGSFRKTKPLKGITIGFCLHITKETSVLLLGAKELGATVVACGGNPLTAQDDIAAFLCFLSNTCAWTNEFMNMRHHRQVLLVYARVPVRCTNHILLLIRLSMHTRVFLLKLEMQQYHLVL